MQATQEENTDTLRIHLIKGIQYVDKIRPSLTKLVKRGDMGHSRIANLVSLQMKNDLSLPRRFVVLQLFIRLKEMFERTGTDPTGGHDFPINGSIDYTTNLLFRKYLENLQFNSIDEEFYKPLDFNLYENWCGLLEVLVQRIYDKHFHEFISDQNK